MTRPRLFHICWVLTFGVMAIGCGADGRPAMPAAPSASAVTATSTTVDRMVDEILAATSSERDTVLQDERDAALSGDASAE